MTLPASARTWLMPALVAALGLAAGLELSLGSLDAGPMTLLAALRGSTRDPLALDAILQLRLPRLVAAVLIGAALAQSGAVMQALFRNPLAEPGLVGVSAGAALAAALSFAGIAALRLPGAQAYALPLAAFGGGLLAALTVLAVASRHGVTRMSTLLLTGAAMNAFVAAVVGLLATRAGDGPLRAFTLWLYGDLGRAGWSELAVAAPLLLATLLWLPRESAALDALLLGDAEAAHLGLDVEQLRRRLLVLAVLGAATTVALAGMIGFVGLIVPHAIRLVLGPGHRALLPASALLGATTLTLADALARSVLAPAELPVGVVTALIGAPFFVLLLRRLGTQAESL